MKNIIDVIINFIKTTSVEWWAIIFSVALGLFNIIYTSLKDIYKEKKEFDKNLFKKIIELWSYRDLMNFLDSLDNKFYNPDFFSDLDCLINFISEPNSDFNNKKIDKIKEKLLKSLTELNIFLTEHFFRTGPLFALYPEHKNSIDSKLSSNYSKRSAELEKIINDCRKNINIFFKNCQKISN